MSHNSLRIAPLPPIPASLPGDPITGNTGGSSGGGQAGTSLQLSYYLYDHLGNTRMVFHTVLKVDEEDPTYVPEYLYTARPPQVIFDLLFSHPAALQSLADAPASSVFCALQAEKNSGVKFSPFVTVRCIADYYPYGKILREWLNCTGERYLTTQHERDIETGYDYRGARFYDADLGRFLSVDPLAAEYAGWSGYVYVLNNPLFFIDPTGKSAEGLTGTPANDGEYERDEDGNWEKVSTIGDEIGVDFFHEDATDTKAQTTYVTDRQGNWNEVTGGRKILGNGRGRRRSRNSGHWQELYAEWRSGTGPETSIFEGEHPNNEALQESNWLQDQIAKFSNEGFDKKGPIGFNWDSGVRATLEGNNDNMHLVFMGSYTVSLYKLGNKNLILAIDDKTRESALGHLPVRNYSRSEGMPYPAPWSSNTSKQMTTTHQRYIFFVDR